MAWANLRCDFEFVTHLSCAGLNRASIHKNSVQKKMDCRVKPGNDNKKARTRSRDAGEKGLFRGMNGVGGSDMHPHAVQPQAEQPFLLVGRIEQLCQRELTRG